jgi:hypothetical protein
MEHREPDRERKPDSFDGVVKGFIEDQAAKKGIAY